MKVKVTQSCLTLCDPMDYTLHGILQKTEEGSLSLLQRISPTQGSNPGLPHCRRVLYQLSHKGSPRILEWVAYPFSSGSSQPRNLTGVSCIADRFFTNRAIREAHYRPIANMVEFMHECISEKAMYVSWMIPLLCKLTQVLH